jgi:hypothetical protein
MRVESVLRVVRAGRDWLRTWWQQLPWVRENAPMAATPVESSEVAVSAPAKKKKTGRPKKSTTPTP